MGEKERAKLLAQDCAVNYIKRARSKATAFDIATQLLAMRSGAAGAADELEKQMGMAKRGGELVKLLTDRGRAFPMPRVFKSWGVLVSSAADAIPIAVGEEERVELLTQKCAVDFITRGKATASDIANQLMATRGAAAAPAAPVMSTPAKAAPRRAPAATPVKLERDPEVVYVL